MAPSLAKKFFFDIEKKLENLVGPLLCLSNSGQRKFGPPFRNPKYATVWVHIPLLIFSGSLIGYITQLPTNWLQKFDFRRKYYLQCAVVVYWPQLMILNPAACIRILSWVGGGQYTIRLRYLNRTYLSLHPLGVVYLVPEQLNIMVVTGACNLQPRFVCCVGHTFSGIVRHVPQKYSLFNCMTLS